MNTGYVDKRIEKIVSEAELSDGYRFTDDEVKKITDYTRRKIEANGKGDDYFGILFKSELHDYVTRKAVNFIGGMMICARRAENVLV